MKKKTIILLTTIAMLSIATAGVGKAYAYFTTYVQAAGSETIRLGDVTRIVEDPVVNGQKKVAIQNNAKSNQAVFVRARAYSGDGFKLKYAGTNWTGPADQADYGKNGWAYYSTPILPGGSTETLTISIDGIPKADVADIDKFNVVVVYESTPAIQNGTDANGNIQYEEPNWPEGGENS